MVSRLYPNMNIFLIDDGKGGLLVLPSLQKY